MLFYTRDKGCPLVLIVFRLKRSLRWALFFGCTTAAANLPPSFRNLFARGGAGPLPCPDLGGPGRHGEQLWSGPLAADMKKAVLEEWLRWLARKLDVGREFRAERHGQIPRS